MYSTTIWSSTNISIFEQDNHYEREPAVGFFTDLRLLFLLVKIRFLLCSWSSIHIL
jgi:hypothetical protein